MRGFFSKFTTLFLLSIASESLAFEDDTGWKFTLLFPMI